MPAFWNCHDLAIRLTYIIVLPSNDALEFLRDLIKSLHMAYGNKVSWYDKAWKLGVGGWCMAAAGGIAAIPPLAAVGGVAFMTGWSIGLFGGIAHDRRLDMRRKQMQKIEELFPVLKALNQE
jgi:hypothetical protein